MLGLVEPVVAAHSAKRSSQSHVSLLCRSNYNLTSTFNIISRVCFFIVIVKRVFLLFNIYFRADTSVLIFRRSVLFFCRWTHKFCFFYFAVKMQEFITKTIIIVKVIIILIKGTRSAGIPLESGANKNQRQTDGCP